MPIYITNNQREHFVDCDLLKQQGRDILLFLNCENQELSVLLTDDITIKQLNKRYRQKDQATDVLSFPQNGGKENELGSRLMGDVVISTKTADRQTSKHGLSLEEEILLLLIHGILHLIGFDHERSEEEAYKMKKKTRELFNQIFPDTKPTESCDFY